MAKKVLSLAIDKEFEPALNELDSLCEKYCLNRSKVIRNAIKQELSRLKRQLANVPYITYGYKLHKLYSLFKTLSVYEKQSLNSSCAKSLDFPKNYIKGE